MDSPFSRYGDFNEEEEEAKATLFFQFGRLFGVSLGAGFQGVSGNRGTLYRGGFPMADFKLHYWFDFNFALGFGFSSVQHNYDTAAPNDRFGVVMNRLGVDLRYYFDTKDLAAPISFSNPYILVGASAFSKTETSQGAGVTDTDNKVGYSIGMGLEFTIRPRKSYFYLEGKLYHIPFEDTANSVEDPALNDLSGFYYSTTLGILFTW